MIQPLVVGQFQENCYIVSHDHDAVIIDPGDDGERLVDYLNSHNLTLKGVLLTHGHIDHISALPTLLKHWTFDTFIHHEDLGFLTDDRLNLSQQFFHSSFSYQGPVKAFMDQEVLDFGSMEFRCHHLPGHTPGSTMFELIGTSTMFAGDVIFKDSIGRYDLPLGNYATTMKSLSKIKQLDDAFILYPGHGIHTTLGYEKIHNPFLKN